MSADGKIVFGNGKLSVLNFDGAHEELVLCGPAIYAKARIESQQWRDMLAAAVREFDRKQIVAVADQRKSGTFDPAELKCPACGAAIITARLHEWRSGLAVESDHSGGLVAWQRKPDVSKFTFECLCGTRATCEIPESG